MPQAIFRFLGDGDAEPFVAAAPYLGDRDDAVDRVKQTLDTHRADTNYEDGFRAEVAEVHHCSTGSKMVTLTVKAIRVTPEGKWSRKFRPHTPSDQSIIVRCLQAVQGAQ